MPQNRGCSTRVDPWRLGSEPQELQGPLVQLLFPYKGSNGARERGLRSWRWRRHPGASACRGRPADMGLQVLLLFAWLGCWTLNLNLSPKTKFKNASNSGNSPLKPFSSFASWTASPHHPPLALVALPALWALAWPRGSGCLAHLQSSSPDQIDSYCLH